MRPLRYCSNTVPMPTRRVNLAILRCTSAARKNAHETAEVLLKHGADVNARHRVIGGTPLHDAAKNNAHETAEVLLKHGADANAKSKFGYTPLYWAEKEKDRETAEVLRRYGGRR